MYNNYNSGRAGHGGSGSCSSGNSRREASVIPTAKPLPKDYMTEAGKAMEEIGKESQKNQITPTKLRNLYSLAMCIYDKELRRSESQLLPEDQTKLTLMEMRVLYECGRDNAVKLFVEKTQLLSYLKGIKNSRQSYLNFAHYMEALVAYHRFLGIGGKN